MVIDGKGAARMYRRAVAVLRSAGSNRDTNARPQSAYRTGRQYDVAAMGASDVAGDRQAESRIADVLIASLVQPQERPEHVFAMLGRNPGSIVVDVDRHEPLLPPRGDDHVAAVTLGVGDEIADAAFHRQRPDPHGEVR